LAADQAHQFGLRLSQPRGVESAPGRPAQLSTEAPDHGEQLGDQIGASFHALHITSVAELFFPRDDAAGTYFNDEQGRRTIKAEQPASGWPSAGSFKYNAREDRWEWSDEVAMIHGYEPGTVTPTTELVLSHKHPDDKPTVAELIEQVRRLGVPFSSRHRIIDTAGKIHVVVVVGDRCTDDAGGFIGTTASTSMSPTSSMPTSGAHWTRSSLPSPCAGPRSTRQWAC